MGHRHASVVRVRAGATGAFGRLRRGIRRFRGLRCRVREGGGVDLRPLRQPAPRRGIPDWRTAPPARPGPNFGSLASGRLRRHSYRRNPCNFIGESPCTGTRPIGEADLHARDVGAPSRGQSDPGARRRRARRQAVPRLSPRGGEVRRDRRLRRRAHSVVPRLRGPMGHRIVGRALHEDAPFHDCVPADVVQSALRRKGLGELATPFGRSTALQHHYRRGRPPAALVGGPHCARRPLRPDDGIPRCVQGGLERCLLQLPRQVFPGRGRAACLPPLARSPAELHTFSWFVGCGVAAQGKHRRITTSTHLEPFDNLQKKFARVKELGPPKTTQRQAGRAIQHPGADGAQEAWAEVRVPGPRWIGTRT